MMGSSYETSRRGEKWGSAIAGIVGISTLVILFGLVALGHCASGCSWGKHPALDVLLPAAAVTASVFAVRWARSRSW